MDIISKIMEHLTEKESNDIYLREIALLMEENDVLKGEVRELKNLIKNYEKKIRGENAKS